MKYPKRKQYKYAKSRYRVRNWPQYESALRCRGDLTVWFSENALDAWRAEPSGKRTYEGFLRSLARLLQLDLPVPDHTTLSRRLQKLGEIRFRTLATDRPIHLLIDSTGLRIHVGHLRKPPRHRAWRKLHPRSMRIRVRSSLLI